MADRLIQWIGKKGTMCEFCNYKHKEKNEQVSCHVISDMIF